MSDERLIDAYARLLDERAAEPREGCATPEEIAALVRREGPEAARLATLDHVMGCPSCLREFELLRAVEQAGGAARPAAGEVRWRRWAPMALAASALLAVGLLAGDRLRNDAADPVRAGGDGIALAAPAADAVVEQGAAVVLAWRPAAGTARYAVELLTAGGELAFTGETADTTLIVAAPPLAGEYRWLVRAQAADGTEARSPARALRVRDR